MKIEQATEKELQQKHRHVMANSKSVDSLKPSLKDVQPRP